MKLTSSSQPSNSSHTIHNHKARKHSPWNKTRKDKKKVPNQRSEESKRRKFPIKDWKKAKKKERKIPDQRSEENKRNLQKGLWTRQYLNNTKLSQTNKKRKETTT